jgi:hypothetical protein
MIKNLLIAGIGGLVLSTLSLTDRDAYFECGGLANCSELGANGFPFPFFSDYVSSMSGDQLEIANRFEIAPALVNFIFWAIIALVLVKLLGWALGAMSKTMLLVVVTVIIAGYFGLMQLT